MVQKKIFIFRVFLNLLFKHILQRTKFFFSFRNNISLSNLERRGEARLGLGKVQLVSVTSNLLLFVLACISLTSFHLKYIIRYFNITTLRTKIHFLLFLPCLFPQFPALRSRYGWWSFTHYKLFVMIQCVCVCCVFYEFFFQNKVFNNANQ